MTVSYLLPFMGTFRNKYKHSFPHKPVFFFLKKVNVTEKPDSTKSALETPPINVQ